MYLLAKTLRVLLAASIALAPISAQAQQNLPYFRYGVYGSTGGSTTPNPDPTNGLLVHVTPDTANAFIGQPVSFIAGVTYVNPPAPTSPPPANRTMLRSAPVITYELIAVQGSIAALGLSFSDNVVSGTLTGNGTASFQIKATDSAGLTGISPVVTVSATPPRIGYGEQIDIVEGYPFVIEGPATNLPTPTFSMAGGVPGATIDSATGTIRGSVPDVETPTLFTFDVVASSGPVTQNSQAKVMALPATSTLTITQGTVLAGAIISGFTTTNLPSPTWTLVAAPPGVAIDPSTGVISGRVDADVGAYVFTARATAPNGATSVTNTVTIEVSPPILAVDVTPGVLKVLKGQPVEFTSTSNEIGIVTFSLVPITGSIESLGLTFDNGRISGTATEAGTATFRIRAVNDAGAFGLSRIVSLTIDERAISYATPGSVMEGSFYQFAAPTTNIPTPTFELISGPVGAVLNPTTGAIEGFVGDILTDQVLTFEVGASNGTLSAVTTTYLVARAASAVVSLNKNPVMASSAIGGRATSTMALGATWSLINAPNGLSIDPINGIISGSVAAVGTYTFSAVASATSGAQAASDPVTLVVEPLVLDVFASLNSQTVFVGQPVNISFTTSNSTGAVTYTLLQASGPFADLGLAFANGVVSGTASAAGAVTFRVAATDAQGGRGESSVVTIVVLTPSVAYDLTGPLVEGFGFTSKAPVTNIPNAVYSLVEPVVGVTLDPATGILTGEFADVTVPSALDVRVRASNGVHAAETIATITVNPGIATVTVSDGAREIGQAFTATSSSNLPAGGTWSLVGSPNGLSINPATGDISGSFAAEGTYSFAAEYVAPNGARVVSPPATLSVVPNLMTVTATPGSQTVFVGESVGIVTTASNASGAVTYTLEPVAGDIATLGLTFNNGVISGQTILPGGATFHVTAVDSEGRQGRTGLVSIVVTGPTLSYASSPRVTEGFSYLSDAPTTSVVNPTFELISGPAGATINPATGVISGTAGDVGAVTAVNFEVRATNGRLSASTQTSILIDPAIASLSLTASAVGVGAPVSGQASSTLPVAGSWLLIDAPAGLSIDPATGVVSGSIAQEGIYTFYARKTALNGASATSLPATIGVTASVMTASATPPSQTVYVGGAISIAAGVNGAVGAVTYEIIPVEGSLADLGLGFANGIVSGATTQVGQVIVRIAAIDSVGQRAETGGIVITATGPTLTYVMPPTVIEGSSFTFAPPTTELTNPTFSFDGPVTGASINPTSGVITGTIGEIAQTTLLQFPVRATSGALSATTTASIIAQAATATLSPPQQKIVVGGMLTAQATTTMIAAGIWSLIDAPAGVSIHPTTGAVSGPSAAIGSYAFAARYTAQSGAIAETNPISAQVVSAEMAITVAPGSMSVLIGSPVSLTSSTLNAVGNVTYTLIPESGDLGSIGLSFSAGSITGTTTSLGTVSFKIAATDSVGDRRETGVITIQVVDGSLAYETITPKFEGDSFASSSPTTNLPNPTYALQPGAPAWVSINTSTGVISGTIPNIVMNETFSVTVVATGGLGSAYHTVAIPVVAGAVAVTSIIDQSVRGVAITAQASTNLTNVTWSLLNAPSWLTINPSTGEISGTTSVGGINSMVVRASYGEAIADSAPITMVIVGPIIAINNISTTPLLGTTIDGNATTNIPGAVFAMENAPPWLTIDSQTGRISGTVSSLAPSQNIIVTATNGTVTAVSTPFSVTPGENTNLTVAGAPPAGFIGQAYSFVPTIENAVGPVTVSVEVGTIPAGLELDASTGGLNGAPIAAGTTSLLLRFTDANGPRLVIYTITINDIFIGFQNLQTVIRSGASFAGSISRNTPNGTFTLVAGPAGLTVSPEGVIGGTASVISATTTQNLTVRYTLGAQIREISAPLSLRPSLALSVMGQTMFVNQGQTHAIQPTISGDAVFPVTWAIDGALFSGYSFNPSAGTINGTGTSPSTQSRRVTVIDSAGYSASIDLTFGTVGPLAVTGGPSGALGLAVGASFTSPPVAVANALSPVSWTLVTKAAGTPIDLSVICPGLSLSNGILTGTPSQSCTVGSPSAPIVLRATTNTIHADGADFWLTARTPVTPQTITYDSGSGQFTVPSYNKLIVEMWGAGGGGGAGNVSNTNWTGTPGQGEGGSDSAIILNGTSYSIIAGGGDGGRFSQYSSTWSIPAMTGIPRTSRASSTNLSGGLFTSTASSYSGTGFFTNSRSTPPGWINYDQYAWGSRPIVDGSTNATGNGAAPGGGAAGLCSSLYKGSSVNGTDYACGSGGAAGGYVRYEIDITDGIIPPGTTLNYNVGVGGRSNQNATGTGFSDPRRGANGRIRIIIE
jgi:hypothetical protein